MLQQGGALGLVVLSGTHMWVVLLHDPARLQGCRVGGLSWPCPLEDLATRQAGRMWSLPELAQLRANEGRGPAEGKGVHSVALWWLWWV